MPMTLLPTDDSLPNQISMKILLTPLIAIALFPSLFGSHQIGGADVERELLEQLNGGSAGRITCDVSCDRVGADGPSTT